MLTRVGLLAIASVSLAGAIACSKTGDVASPLRGTPFAELGVTLPATQASLQNARPNARLTPYSGFHETVSGIDVAYLLPPGAMREAVVDRSANIDMMTAFEPVATKDEGRRRWKSAVASLSAIHGVGSLNSVTFFL
jgi:hypothetical protein